MDIEDGVIWVYGVGEDGIMAFTDFGIENLVGLIKIYKEDPRCSGAGTAANRRPAAYAGWLRSRLSSYFSKFRKLRCQKTTSKKSVCRGPANFTECSSIVSVDLTGP